MLSCLKTKRFLSPIILTVDIGIFYLVLFAIFGVVRYGSLDDYFMATILNGAYGSEFDPHLVFVNVLIGYLLFPLITIFPKIDWFYFFEMGSIFASFTVFSFFLIRQTGRKMGVPFALLLSSLSLNFYAQVSFTQCAALLVAAGGVSFILGAKEKRMSFLYIGILFLIIGAALRWQMFLLGLPFLALTFFLQSDWREIISIKAIVATSLCAASLFTIHFFDESFYKVPEYQYYKAYQSKRSLFGDGRHFDKEAVYDELEERGLQGRDFQLLNEWTFYDTEVFSADSLDKIIQVVNRNVYPINNNRVPAAISLAISNAFMQNETWCWCLSCIYLLVFSQKRSRLYPWASLAAVTLGYIYLFLLNRLSSHVEMGMWVYATVLAIPFMQKTDNYKMSRAALLLAIGFVLISISTLPQTNTTRHFVATPQMSESWRQFLSYADNHSEKVFLLSFEQYKDLGMVKDPAYRAPAPGSWKNIFPIGYWNINLPAMKKELKNRSIDNPLRDIVKENVFLLETGNIPHYQTFYKTHYHKALFADTVASFGKLQLLKYHEVGVENE